MRTIAVVAAAALLASLVAMVTWGGLNKLRQPQLALIAVPANGFAYAQAVLMGIAAQVGDTPGRLAKVPLNSAQRANALASYTREPFSSQGLAITALAAEADGDRARARRLMGAALELSRRDSLVNGWSVLDASRRNDLAGAVVALNRSMTVNPATSAIYVPVMVKSLEQEASIEVLARVLARRPDWELAFWRTAVQTPQSIGAAARLRARLPRTSPQDQEIDRGMLLALANARAFADAATLYRARAGATANSTIVNNPAFATTPTWPPFDWQVLATGEFSGTVTRNGQGLVAESLPGSGGLIARQLIFVQPRPMRLRAVLAHPFETGGNGLAIRLQCATTDAAVLEFDLTTLASTRDFSPGRCRFHWLDVLVQPGIAENREPLALRRIDIAPR